MKKIVKLSLVLITVCMICMMGRVYAALSCNVSLNASKTQVSKGEEFTIDAYISNIQSDRGVISLGATLEYDKESLTLVKMEGLNEWETPKEGKSYNSSNGKMAIERDSLGKNNETFLRITFKVNNNNKQNLNIVLKDIIVADGTTPARISQVSKAITVTTGTTGNGNTNTNNVTNGGSSTDNGTTNNVNKNNIGNTNSNNNSDKTTNTIKINKDVKKDKELPKTGDNTIILISAIAILVIGAVVFFIKMKISNK